LSDAEAAWLLGQRYRSGCRDVEELQYDLDQIAFLDPTEARLCVDWLHAEVMPGEWRYPGREGSALDWAQFVSHLAGKVEEGERIRALAAAPLLRRREWLRKVQDLDEATPEWWSGTREVVLAETLVDPAEAAELALELWDRRGYADTRCEQEVARRLWLQNPGATLSFLDHQKQFHCGSLLPILLQRTLSAPSAEHLGLAVELMVRMERCSWGSLCISVARVLHSLVAWDPEERSLLIKAAVQAVLQFDPLYDDPRARHASFKEELAAHLTSLPISSELANRLSAELLIAVSADVRSGG
jgi:hypothetical protein